ncbi:MAG: hypothetical protein C0501_16855 [Isosphaera sp.]|nr:hypothetical protein [Isosphaera sp.]
MRNNVLNVTFFLAIAVGLYFLYTHAEQNWFPKPPPREQKKSDPTPDDARKAADDRKAAASAAAGAAAVAAQAVPPAPKPEPPKVTPRPDPTLIALGDDGFYNRVLLSTQGGGVQQVVLPKFAEADRLGREVPKTPLYLIPGIPRDRGDPQFRYLKNDFPIPDLKVGKVPAGTALADPAFTLTHYPTPDDKHPDPRLAEVEWAVPDGYRDAAGNPAAKVLENGTHEVVFEAELGDPYFVKFRKTYTLGPRDYHVGLKVEVEKKKVEGAAKGKGQLRLQLSGPRGVPVEGEWYTTTYRVALVGWQNSKGAAQRQYETAAEVAAKRGGEAVQGAGNTFKYMGVANQYFFSGVAIDDTAEGSAKKPWAYVRATTELPFGKKQDPNQPQFDDVTVRAASDILDLAPGDRVEHKYLLYNGPAKVSLLGLMEGDRAVDEGLVKRYRDGCGLKTVTDYQSPTWLGSFASWIYWTDLVVAFTNLMHWLLAAIHTVVPDWALSIVVLTLVVRLVLMYPSKKQTRMNLRMMEIQKRLAPQFEELKKKYADDFHGYNRAKMQLMLANGVNPAAQLGGCLLLFAQMPIMMGLYFCLQESVFFRLEHFLWIDNLSAPDMTLWWTEKIPYISSPDNLGGILYLGPYLNVLPVLAVGLMIGQQLLMLPPATDDQSRQQRTIMKMMMVMMPIFFFKFAAGLALYFIIGTVWALVERRVVGTPDVSKLGTGPTPGGPPSANGAAAPPPPDKPKGFLGRLKERVRERMEEMQRQADEQSRRQIRNEKDGPGPAPGPDGGGPPRRGPDRRDRDRKKKRRK